MLPVTLWVLSVDMQNPLCAFHTLTVVSDEADITTKGKKVTTGYVFVGSRKENLSILQELEFPFTCK